MKKILFAIGNRQAEDYIKSEILEKSKDYEFVGNAVHKGNIIELIKNTSPDILILREGLDGKENIFALAKSIKYSFTNLRIIFLTSDRNVGDLELATLVGYGIYDIIVGTTTNILDVIDFVFNPRELKDVKKYLPKTELFKENDFNENDKENLEEKKLINEIISEELLEKNENKEKKKSLFDTVINASKKISETKIKNIEKKTDNKDEEDLEDMKQKMLQLTKDLEEAKKEKNKPIIEKKEETKQIKEIENKKNNIIKKEKNAPIFLGKDKIITFFSAKNGIGTTTVAFTVAMDLALRKNKVLYIEFNEFNPMIAYWLYIYDVFGNDYGLDKAILGLETNNFKEIRENIITKEILVQANPEEPSLKKFPTTLDYMFFSSNYIEQKNKPIFSNNSFSQMLMYIIQQLNYNYLIIDMNTHSEISLIETALTFSNKNYIVVSQEFSSIGYFQSFLKKLEQKDINFNKDFMGEKDVINRNTYIVNRYNGELELDLKTIKEWLEVSKIFTLSSNDKEISDFSLNLKPIMTYSKNNRFKAEINEIATDIEKV